MASALALFPARLGKYTRTLPLRAAAGSSDNCTTTANQTEYASPATYKTTLLTVNRARLHLSQVFYGCWDVFDAIADGCNHYRRQVHKVEVRGGVFRPVVHGRRDAFVKQSEQICSRGL